MKVSAFPIEPIKTVIIIISMDPRVEIRTLDSIFRNGPGAPMDKGP